MLAGIKTHEEYHQYTAVNNNKLLIRGNGHLKHLKSAVVMADIIVDGGEPIHLAYAPVNFEENFDFDGKEAMMQRLFIFGGIVVVFAFMGSLVWYFLKVSRGNAQKDFETQISSRGIPMSDITSQSSSRNTQQSSMSMGE